MTAQTVRQRRTFLLLCLAFVVTGVDCTMLGPALPTLAAAWHLRDANSGLLLFMQPVAGILASALSTRNLYRSIVGGGALLTLGLLLFGTGNFAVAHLALAMTGFGFGLLLAAGNLQAGLDADRAAHDENSGARSNAIAILNFAWGVGAILSGAVFNRFRAHGHPFAFFWTLAAAMAVTTLACAVGLPRHGASRDDDAPPHAVLPVSVRAAFAAAVLLYSGMEDGISGWLPTYSQRLLTLLHNTNAATLSAYAVTAFFLAEMTGRLLMPLVLKLTRESRLYIVALALLLAALGGLFFLPVFSPQSPVIPIAVLVILAGLGVAPVYPLILSMMIARSRDEHGLGWVFACGGLGGGSLPLLGGILSSANAQPMGVRWAFVVPMAAGVALLALRPRLVTAAT